MQFNLKILFAGIFCLFAVGELGATPRHVYLTWQHDTSGTMTVNYQTMEEAGESMVYFDTKPRRGEAASYRYRALGTHHQIEGLEDGRWIHWVELTGLKAGSTYYFVAGNARNGFSEERKFATVPDGQQKLRFAVGGDMGTGPALDVLLREAALREPNFAVVGGDIAYAGDRLTNYFRWDSWLDSWERCMVTPKQLTIPMVLAIGNHEVREGTNAVFYRQFFAQQPDRSYYSRKFGKNLVIYLLDSGHLTPHGGVQAEWLDGELAADSKIPQRFAVYHVGMYPAYRSFDGAGAVAGRNAWLPIFDRHHLTAAFEHHDHVFKRTKLLRGNQVDPKGTLYLGDGCWGQGTRKVGPTRKWYEAKAGNAQHFWLVDVSRRRVEYRAINKEGKVFDVFPPEAKGAREAEEVFMGMTGEGAGSKGSTKDE